MEQPTILESEFNFPPSTNHAYAYTSRGGRASSYITAQGKEFKAHVWQVLKEHWPDFSIPPKTPLYIELHFNCTPKTLNKRDLNNSDKLLVDEIFRVGGGDDRYIRKMTMDKQPGPVDSVLVILGILDKKEEAA